MTAGSGRLVAFVVVFLIAACLPARAGMLFAGGVEVDGPGAGRPAAPAYDPLPQRFEDLDQYEQIAMEPYRDTYDAMQTAEKAKVYGRQFVFMNDREPNFPPDVAEAVRDSAAATLPAREARQFLYKPATPKPPRPTPEEETGEVLKALSGPWEANKPAEPEATPGPEERRRDSRSDDRRMETLRRGWNASDVLRGSRDR